MPVSEEWDKSAIPLEAQGTQARYPGNGFTHAVQALRCWCWSCCNWLARLKQTEVAVAESYPVSPAAWARKPPKTSYCSGQYPAQLWAEKPEKTCNWSRSKRTRYAVEYAPKRQFPAARLPRKERLAPRLARKPSVRKAGPQVQPGKESARCSSWF